MSHVWMRHVPYMNGTCHTHTHTHTRNTYHIASNIACRLLYKWVMSHIWMTHVLRMNESCSTYGWVMSRIWIGHVPHMCNSCPISKWVMSHVWMSHVPYKWVMSHMHTTRTALQLTSHLDGAVWVWCCHTPINITLTHVNESCHTCLRHIPHCN